MFRPARAQPFVARPALLGRHAATRALGADDLELRVGLETKPSRDALAAPFEDDGYFVARLVSANHLLQLDRTSDARAGHGQNDIVTFQARPRTRVIQTGPAP